MRHEISWWQLTMIFTSVNLSILASYAPVVTGMLPPVRDAWLAALIAAIPGFVLAFVSYALVKRLQGQNLFELTTTVLGKFFGTVVNIGLTAYFVHWSTILTREFALFMDSVVYLRTPDIVFVIIFVILAIVGASQQIEFIGRIAELSGVLVMVGIVFLILANIPQMDIGMLSPVLAEGWQPVLHQSLTPMGIFAEAVWVVLLAGPYLNRMKDGPKALGIGLGLNTLFGVASAATLIALFGPELISILAFAPLTAARLIQIGHVLERLEWILLLLWFASMGVKVSLLLFGARLGLSSLFPRWRLSTSLTIVSGLVFIWSLFLFQTLSDILDFFDPKVLLPQISPPLLLPVLLITVAFIRGTKTSNKQIQENAE